MLQTTHTHTQTHTYIINEIVHVFACISVCYSIYIWVSGNVWFIERFMCLMCRALVPVKLDSDETSSNVQILSPIENKMAIVTTNNRFEILALKHYKAFQFIRNQIGLFSFLLPAVFFFVSERTKGNYYWILFCLLIYFCFLFFFLFGVFFLYSSSTIQYHIDGVWACRTKKKNIKPVNHAISNHTSWGFDRVCERAYFVCTDNYEFQSCWNETHAHNWNEFICILLDVPSSIQNIRCVRFFSF